ncbi:helix-turn-helix domain-containing protein [Marinicella rhabdoformis]|uniref:helix-turn-helix domain-containing protein n=1 Tax=Marinicella rhabdoformis TaxID=2580566 RepID=UPI0012AEBBAF|nr:helix-turn-helix domain-containing protein [Marinicella rhabdoformis]
MKIINSKQDNNQLVNDFKAQKTEHDGKSQKGCTQRAVHHYLKNLNGHETVTNDLYDLVIAETEKGMILEVLDWCKGNQSKAAQLLGITRTTLRNKIRKLGL